MLALLAGASSLSVSTTSSMARQAVEAELLRIGEEFSSALQGYKENSSNGQFVSAFHGPTELEELTRDTRSGRLVRHLRKIYADPLTGRVDWGIVRDENGFILGIYSLADGKPIKQEGFVPTQAAFRGAESYREWVFGERADRVDKVIAVPRSSLWREFLR